MNSSSMSMRMKKIATVENLIAKRPSDTSIGSLPHSNGSALTGVSRRGAMREGMKSSAPATAAPTANTSRIGTYCTALREGGGVGLTPGVVGAAHQWARLDVGEADLAADRRQLGELVGMVVTRHRQVLARWTQVLAQRQDRHPHLDEVAQGGHQLVTLLAQSQ